MAEQTLISDAAIIYGIIDPRTHELFYVGKTKAGRLRERMWAHRTAGRRNDKLLSARKIRGILQDGYQPDAFVIETLSEDNWVDAEQFWIEYFKSIGCVLANHTIGGEGLNGVKHTKEAVAKMVTANLGKKKSDECRANIKASWTAERKLRHIEFCKTREMPAHQRALLSKVHKGKKLSEWHKERMLLSNKGKVQTEEQKRKSGDGVKASWTDQRRREQSARMVLRKASQTHCKRGHLLSGDNLRSNKTGRRMCKACGNALARVRAATKRRELGIPKRTHFVTPKLFNGQ